MKLRLFSFLILLLAGTSLCFGYTWGTRAFVVDPITLQSDQVILNSAGGIDDPQPDTLLYDNGTGTTLNLGGPYWSKVKFTAPVDFQLRSVYVLPLNQYNNTTSNLTIHITDDNGGVPGSLLQTIVMPAPITPGYTQWTDLNLTTPIDFAEGESFHIMYNCPGGTYPGVPGSGWWNFFDSGTTTNRSYYGTSPTGPWSTLGGDLLLRAGGELQGGFIDLTTLSVYNQEDLFFFEVGEQIHFKARVQNIGVTDADFYTFKWEVFDETSTSVWTFENAYMNLTGGQTVILSADSAWTAPANGYYTVEGLVTHPEDADTTNDNNSLEVGINSLDAWYLYDDGSNETNFNFSQGDGIGNEFIPSYLPVKVDTIAINMGAGGLCDVKVYQSAATGGPSVEMWSTSATLTAGWNYFSPGVSVHLNGFSVIVEPQATISIYMDDTPPLAGSNIDMRAVTWQNEGGWVDFERGDLMIRAYITESFEPPPYPVLELSADTVFFPVTLIGTTSSYFLTVTNGGGEQNLLLNNISIANPQFQLVEFMPGMSIGPGVSEDIQIDFSPDSTSADTVHTIMLIQCNATPPMVQVHMYGYTEQLSVGENQTGTPASYMLRQNYPNPFNPVTSIDFAIPTAGHVELAVYNVLGEQVAKLIDGNLQSGFHTAEFNAENLVSGIYFYRLTAGNYSEMKKMILMK